MVVMTGSDSERWRELCVKAAVERDPKKLEELALEINWLLEMELERLRTLRGDASARRELERN